MNFYYADENNQAVGPITEDQLRTLVRNGSIKPDTQVFQEGTTEWCQYGLIAPPPNPPGMATTQPLCAAPVGKQTPKNTSQVVLVTILATAIISGFAYYYNYTKGEQTQRAEAKPPKPTPKPEENVNTAVDAITGFSTFALGSPSADFKSRVKADPFRDPTIEKLLGNTEETVAELTGNEKEWAGFAVSKVRLRFAEGIISIVRVELSPSTGFPRAFELRYGKPTYSGSSGAGWRGNNTTVSISWALGDGRDEITITSKKTDDFVEKQKIARSRKENEASEQRAQEAAKKF